MTDFLDENNTCGQNILQIVSVGNAIIAELLRLKDYIPDVFKLETKEDQIKYSELVLDFSFFKISELHDKKIEENTVLQELDEEFRDNHLEILTRFYLAFESIHQYINDLNNFIQELHDGLYIQQTLETTLQDPEGKQLLCESLYLYGVILFVLDIFIPGILRERLLVSYYRYCAQKSHGESNIDDVCKLVRSTGYSNLSNTKRVQNYPEEYFRRIPIDKTFIEMVIGRLRSDDVYNQVSVYPLPAHRSTALANQGAMLYVCLFFAPDTLKNKSSRMREIVDKFFPDNWIVSIYMGITINLINSWEPYKAAKSALNNVFEQENFNEVKSRYARYITKLLPQLRNILKEGFLTEQILLKNITKVINLIRECNVTLRWVMLHTSESFIDSNNNKRCKQVRDDIIENAGYRNIAIFELLLNTSQLELKVKDILKDLITEKEMRWNNYQKDAADHTNELSEVFSGEKLLTKIEKIDDLRMWFQEINKEILMLNINNPNIAGRKIILLIQALEEVQEFHNLDSNMQIKQYLIETRQYLHQMVQTINIKEDLLINLQLIGDLSYAWILIDKYTTIMQENIKKQPNLIIKLRSTFLKLASALEIPLLRINQAHSDDLISVSKYYSNVLVEYVRKVVQIIPQTMFEILTKIINLQTDVIKELPTRLDKDKVKEYAQLEDRFTVAKLTYSISVFTEGILTMKRTLVGIIEVDPKQLLEDGIRKELVINISNSLNKYLIFNTKLKQSELETKLIQLGKIMDGYRRSFEYVQDYINIHGLKIWQEEMTRIINYNVEKECNSFLKNKIPDWDSKYQNSIIPIPTYASIDSNSVNFIGRLGREILRQTDPRTTIHDELNSSWHDFKSQKELLNIKFFNNITNSIGPPGIIGLDKLYSFMIIKNLQEFLNSIKQDIFKDKLVIEQFDGLIKELSANKTIANPNKYFNNCLSRFIKIVNKFYEPIVKIGQLQLLRKYLLYELNINCKFNSRNLESSLRTMNDAVLLEIKRNWNSNNMKVPNNEILYELNKYLECAGIINPFDKIYVTTNNVNYNIIFLLLIVINYLPKLKYESNIATIIGKRTNDHVDGISFIIGLITILKQFHSTFLYIFVEYISQYALSLIDANLSLKKELNPETLTCLYFIEIFIDKSNISRDLIEKYIPESILNQIDFLSTKK